jgi:1-deoxy-D-xylulose-5-phosphate reductoisomerase
MIKISIVGSTGSIGVNTLRVVAAHAKALSVEALAARQNTELLIRQAKQFRPKWVCIFEPERALLVEKQLKPLGIRVVTGEEGLRIVSTLPSVDKVVFAVVGAVGLRPILAAVQAGKTVAVANKEPLVMAGELLLEEAKRSGAKLIPIDSEHSGLWQCLEGRAKTSFKKLILTSSGGPFFGKKMDLRKVTSRQALKHPRWKMGPKITIDSATLMNKGLEIIEACNLFDVALNQVDVVIHPEAVVHALVEFIDGSQLAQLGITDMRLPIQYALSYPNRFENSLPNLNLTEIGTFRFFKPEKKRFPCLELGCEAKRRGGTVPTVLNAANEIAVDQFLKGAVTFVEIPKIIERVMSKHRSASKPTLNQILEADKWGRLEAQRYA